MATIEVITGGQRTGNVIVATPQPVSPAGALPPDIGWVEISTSNNRGSIWYTGSGAPITPAGQPGDMYLDIDNGDVYRWDGTTWVLQGTFAPSTDTPAEILAKLITVDGAGSLLDADTLDGHDSPYFATDVDMNSAEMNITILGDRVTSVENTNTAQDASIALKADKTYVDTQNVLKADIASPTFTGDPKAPTAAPGDNDTSVATTAFVTQAVGAVTVDAYTKAQADTKFVDVAGDTMTGKLNLPAGTTAAATMNTAIGVAPSSPNNGDWWFVAPSSAFLRMNATTYQLAFLQGTQSFLGLKTFSTKTNFSTPTTSLASINMPHGSAPTAPVDGDLWTTTTSAYARINGVTVDLAGGGAATTISDTAPLAPVVGQLWYEADSGNTYIWYSDADSSQWVQVNIQPGIVSNPAAGLTAETRNRLVNPAMQISQELGDTAVATGASGGGFPTDQWQASWGLTGTANAYRSRPSDTGNDYVVMSIIGATTSPAAGAYCQLLQAIEGVKIKDFLWGTAAAKQAVFRFNLYTNATGTYSMLIKNGAGDRTFLAPFTVTTANAWKSYSIVVPGDTTGTWPTTTVLSMTIGFGFAAGTTYGGGVAGWQAGNKIQITGNTNGAATAGNVFLVADVGLYLDPLNTGVAPRWTMPDEAQELAACMRYWERTGAYGSAFCGSVASGGSYFNRGQWLVTKRIAPALAGVNQSAASFPTAIGTLGNDGVIAFTEARVASATNNVGLYYSSITGNARM